MPYDRALAARVRQALAGREVREVAMFGGLSFMMHDRLAVSADGAGNLLIRCDAARVEELIAAGATWAQMRGRTMAAGWLRVDRELVREEPDLQFWVGAAVEYATGR